MMDKDNAGISKILILAGAEIDDYEWAAEIVQESDLVICADSGLRHARVLDIVPDVLVGDFDSVNVDDMKWAKSKSVEVVTIEDQDQTDLQKALSLTTDEPDADIIILGGLGGRMDHQFANILILERFENPSRIVIADPDTDIRLLHKSFAWTGTEGDMIGVIPLRDTKDLRYKGLKFEAEGLGPPYTLGWLGTSNEMTTREASIHFNGGLVLFIHTKI